VALTHIGGNVDILGVDVSLTSLGWFLQDGKPSLTYGSFKTTPKDGLLIERFMLQRDRFEELVSRNGITHIGIEQPLEHIYNSELLFALHQFIFEVCYKKKINVVYITPAQIKQYVTGNHLAQKNEIIIKTREVLGFKREKINDDECDAFWVSLLTKRFWGLYYKELTEDTLTEAERFIFIKTKSKKLGILKKPNISFYIFNKEIPCH